MAFGAVEKLQILIEAKFQGDGARRAKQELGGLEQAADKGARNLGKLAKGAAVVGGALAGAAVAAKQAYDALKEGAALNTAANQFDILTAKINTTADALLGRMREASQGFSSDAQLIDAGNQIISLGLAKTEDDVANLAAVIGGLGLDMQQVILTFANNSKARLDSLGLSVEGVNEKVKELEQAGFEGDAFDAAVLQLLTQRYQEMSGAIDDTEKAIRRAETAYANFIDSAKRGFATEVGESILGFEQRAQDIENLIDAFKRGQIDVHQFSNAIGQLLLLNPEPLREISDAVEESFNKSIQATGSFTSTSVAAWGRFIEATDDAGEGVRTIDDMIEDSIRTWNQYEWGILSAAEAVEELGDKSGATEAGMMALAEVAKKNLGEIDEAAGRASERMADAFSEFIDSDGEAAIEDVNKALYEQIEAAGADAETLAFAGVALGQFTEAQAKAALEQAALNEKLVELGKEVANGNLTIDQALEKFDSYRQGLQDTEAQAQRNKEATIEYTQSINDIPEEKRTELFVEKESAVNAVDDLRRRLDEIPRSIDIDVNVNVPPIPEVYRPGGEQNYDGTNIPARATGGPVSAFQPYIVGERGPEMFVPSQNGTIVPNGAMGNTFNISVNVSAGGGGADRALIPIVRDGVLEALQRAGAY